MDLNINEIIFWIAAAIIFYTFLGYGIILFALVKLKLSFQGKVEKPESEELPHLTLVIAAYNEADIVEAKMANCFALRYPEGRLHILWVTDGTTDQTNELLKGYPEVKVCYKMERRGKTAALNHAMEHVSTPLVAFTDANTMLNEDALSEIGEAFTNPSVGCVAGEKRIIVGTRDGATAGGEGIYWRYESKLKEWDSMLYSTVGAAGELFAIRTGLYRMMPEDTLLDDFMISMDIASRGFKIEYCRSAFACEYGSADMRNEEKRKVRIAAGGLQAIWRLARLLNIFRYGTLSFQYISHRVLRWSLTPLLMVVMYPLNLWLAVELQSPLYITLFVLQNLFYLSAAAGAYFQHRKIKVKALFVPLYFVFMNLNVLRAVPYLMKNKGKGTWEKAERI